MVEARLVARVEYGFQNIHELLPGVLLPARPFSFLIFCPSSALWFRFYSLQVF
jgi:hypothetical protein